MPRASDFYVRGATADDLEKLDLALSYIAQYMPVNGAPVMEQLAELGITLSINHSRVNEWNNDTRVLSWDPNTALVVVDGPNEDSWVGINSPATNLLHEAAHATDPNFDLNHNSPNGAFGDEEEAYAANVASSGAAEAGEVERGNHSGWLIEADNPTTHTYEYDSGTIAWTAFDESMGAMWQDFSIDNYDNNQCPSFDMDAEKPGRLWPEYLKRRKPIVSMNSLLIPNLQVPAGRLIYESKASPVGTMAFIEQPPHLIGVPGHSLDGGAFF